MDSFGLIKKGLNMKTNNYIKKVDRKANLIKDLKILLKDSFLKGNDRKEIERIKRKAENTGKLRISEGLTLSFYGIQVKVGRLQ